MTIESIMSSKLTDLLRSLRLLAFGPRTVESVTRSFNNAVSDLKETARHHYIHAVAQDAAARRCMATAEQHRAEVSRANRVADRIKSLVS